MLENITFEDSGEKVSVTIDNESIELPISKINRLPTYIELNQSLNTALENNIELNASIFYTEEHTDNIEDEEINTEVTEEEDEDSNTAYLVPVDYKSSQLSIDGSATVTIYNNDSIYYIKDIHFKEGNIIDSIKNTLPLGSYLMIIEYAGNKYFQPSRLEVNFNVEKRLSKCTLEQEKYYGDFKETLHISGTLTDNERGTPVNDCVLNYDFNGETNTISTNHNGEFSFNITIPEPDIEHCVAYYDGIEEPNLPGELYQDTPEEEVLQGDEEDIHYEKDEDGNIIIVKYSDNEVSDDNDEVHSDSNSSTIEYYEEDIDTVAYYPNASYIVNIYTDNESYYLNDTEIEIIANKAPVSITITSTNSDTVSNIVSVVGRALAYYNNQDNDVKYGEVEISFPNLNYTHPYVSIKNGIFNADINLIDVYSIYNQSEVDEIQVVDMGDSIDTIITLTSDNIYNKQTDEGYVKTGDNFIIEATVSTKKRTKVPYGALLFSLMDDKKNIIYQYTTELDKTGKGVLNFNTSKAANYFVKAEYLAMFDYKHSESSGEDEVRVKDVI